MSHLTIDQIIDFVSMNQINDETLKLASTVNKHIGKCEKCLRKVRAFQLVYDEFVKLGKECYFDSIIRSIKDEKLGSIGATEIDDIVSGAKNECNSLFHSDKIKSKEN